MDRAAHQRDAAQFVTHAARVGDRMVQRRAHAGLEQAGGEFADLAEADHDRAFGFGMPTHVEEQRVGVEPPRIQAELEPARQGVAELAVEGGFRTDHGVAQIVADQHRVDFTSTGKSIRVDPGETVHAAAAKLGLHIPKACGMGICGTCKVMKTAGEVEMEHNGGITDEDVAEGYILSCCSVPKGDVAIDY